MLFRHEKQTARSLTHALTIGKTVTESKTIAQTEQGQALSVFMSGVHPVINTILEARAIETFELAVIIAIISKIGNLALIKIILQRSLRIQTRVSVDGTLYVDYSTGSTRMYVPLSPRTTHRTGALSLPIVLLAL